MKISKFLLIFIFMTFFNFLSFNSTDAKSKEIDVGVLAYGTVNWELDTLQHHRLDEKNQFELVIKKLGGKNASAVALQGKEVDAIVTDWIWVSRQRNMGKDYTFVPHSITVGGLMVNPESGIKTLKDLEGRKVGVAGGPVDKSWLMLRAYAKKKIKVDLISLVDPTYAAPPLLNKIMLKGELPAVLNFWHYNARLRAAGMEELLSVHDLLPALGVDQPPPLIGWVFSEKWAGSNLLLVSSFLKSLREAKMILLNSDSEWDRLRPLIKAKDDKTFFMLREAYRAGIPRSFNQADIDAAATLFATLAQYGGKDLVGEVSTLSKGTFWSGFRY